MELHVEDLASATVVRVRGRVDATTAPAFEDRLLRQATQPVDRLVLDCRDLEFLSSLGLRSLLVAARRRTGAGRTLVLGSLSPRVHPLFEVSGLLELFAVTAWRDEALAVER